MVIKYIPEDFIVHEVMVTENRSSCEAPGWYMVRLEKKGYSTYDAMSMIESELGLNQGDVTAAGLKDSDGITTQTITLPRFCSDDALPTRLQTINKNHSGVEKFIRLTYEGTTDAPLRPGKLLGNAFRLTLRDLDPDTASGLGSLGHLSLLFPNYYDKQRFGMPGHEKVTHLIGYALAEGDYKKAYEYVLKSGARESAFPFNGDHKAFFDQISDRVKGFYAQAVYSNEFNLQLEHLLKDAGPTTPIEDEGLVFSMPQSAEALLKIQLSALDQGDPFGLRKNHSAIFQDGRRLVNGTELAFSQAAPDEYFPGKSRISVSFFLGYGAYATMAMKQLEALLYFLGD